MKELKRKNVMYDRLLKEYEIAKGKVRKYRSEKSSVSSTSAVALEDKYYLRQGANLALEKANQVYNQHLQKLDSDYISVLEVMQSRLEQLAICIEQILNNGLLEELSDSMRDILQRSLNDHLDISSYRESLELLLGNGPGVRSEETLGKHVLTAPLVIRYWESSIGCDHNTTISCITQYPEACLQIDRICRN